MGRMPTLRTRRSRNRKSRIRRWLWLLAGLLLGCCLAIAWLVRASL